jgi:hypothetical protein
LTTVTFSGATPSLTQIDVFYSEPATGTISGLTNLMPGSGVTATIVGGNEVVLALSPALSSGVISYDLMSSTGTPGVDHLSEVFGSSTSGSVTIGYSLGAGSVPEPSSMALLGIGMTGFLAFRRLFKRTSVA